MTPGERRRRDRKYAREEGWKSLRDDHPNLDREALRSLPHPKRSIGSAWDYVSWLIDQGYYYKAHTYLEGL